MRNCILVTKLVSFLLLFGACNNVGPVQKAILAKSDSCKFPGNQCIFMLSDITNFEWDRMYLFGEDTRLEKISSILKTPYETDIGEDNVRMIFTRKGKIVHQEDYDWGSNARRRINYIDLPYDTTSNLTEKGCFTKLIPYVTKEEAKYELSIVGPETNPLFSKFEKKNQRNINLILLKDLGKCYEEQSTVEDIN